MEADQEHGEEGQNREEQLHESQVVRVPVPQDVCVAEEADHQEHLLSPVGDFWDKLQTTVHALVQKYLSDEHHEVEQVQEVCEILRSLSYHRAVKVVVHYSEFGLKHVGGLRAVETWRKSQLC